MYLVVKNRGYIPQIQWFLRFQIRQMVLPFGEHVLVGHVVDLVVGGMVFGLGLVLEACSVGLVGELAHSTIVIALGQK